MLNALYAIAIGLLIVAFVGFGIAAFYPEPEFPEYPPALEEVGDDPTAEERAMMADQRQKEEAYSQEMSRYNQVVALISIGSAVLLLGGSLLWMGGLAVMGDGVTLGAVFTLFYGLVRAIMTESEVFRFIAVAVGLAIVLALVYVRVIRRPTGGGAAPLPRDRPA